MEQDKNNNNNLKGIKVATYTDDMVRAIEDDKTGLIKKLIDEDEQHQAERKNLSPQSRRNKLFVVIGACLLCMSLVTLFFVVFFHKEITTIPVEVDEPLFIFADDRMNLEITELDKSRLSDLIESRKSNTEVKEGGIEALNLIESGNTLTFSRFLEIVESDLLVSFDESLVSERFLLGTYNNDTENSSFLLLRTRAFNDSFDMMRIWEDKILYDLNEVFGVGLSLETSELFTKPFVDEIVANKNARVLFDTSIEGEEKIVLMYVFINDEYVIVTDSKDATTEVVKRIFSSSIRK